MMDTLTRPNRRASPAAARALVDSIVEAAFAEEETLESLEAGPDFGSPLQPARPVRANLVSCSPPSAAIAAITGPDPVGGIQAANTRAIRFLDRAITDLQNTRNRVVAGTAPATAVSAAIGTSLNRRFGLDANDRAIWTGRGARSVFVLIRRLRGSRQILADGWMAYTCLGPAAPATVTLDRGGRRCTVVGCEGEVAFTCGGNSRIVLCPPFWQTLGLKDRAATLLHEAIHIYFTFIDDAGRFANAHCYEQLTLDLNGEAPTPGFETSCA